MRTARVGLPGRVRLCRGTTGAALPRLRGQPALSEPEGRVEGRRQRDRHDDSRQRDDSTHSAHEMTFLEISRILAPHRRARIVQSLVLSAWFLVRPWSVVLSVLGPSLVRGPRSLMRLICRPALLRTAGFDAIVTILRRVFRPIFQLTPICAR